MNKKIVILLIIGVLLVFIVSFVIAKNINSKDTSNVVNTNTNVQRQNNQSKQNVVKNEINNNVINNTVENTTVEPANEEKQEENASNTETFDGDVKTEEQKAINIVRRDYGNGGSNTKISVDGMNANGTYIVVVRDSATTEALAYYNVNAQTGDFTKKEVY